MTAWTGNAQPLPNPRREPATTTGDPVAGGPCSPATPSAGSHAGTLAPELATLLDCLRADADEQGLISPRLRWLAGELGVPTRALRRRLVELVRRGALHDVGMGAYALPGTAAATLTAGDDDDERGPRLPPHDAVHDLPGWVLPW